MVIEGDETRDELIESIRNLAAQRHRCRDRQMKAELLSDIDRVLDELLTRKGLS